MNKLKCVFDMIVEQMYTEFTENEIKDMSTDEVGKVADILKDLAETMKHTEGMEMEQTPGDVTSILTRAQALMKETEMNAIEKGALKSKLQMMIQSL